jgi:2-polyprenyl-3-methyl-5-hydroxy-6-metoxy-1,4-benzoquinol methylase
MMIDSRLDAIRDIVRGKRVLDVGCVDHESSNEQGERWLHRIIGEQASELTGLDFEAEEVEKLKAKGYNIIFGNAEVVDLGRKFDVVVAGELIEHLSNPGNFLENMRRHLEPGGTLVMTTPNPFYPKRFAEVLFEGKARVNGQHVSWFCPQTLYALLSRAGYAQIEILPFNNSERWRRVVDRLSAFRPWFATNLMVTGINPA